MRLIDADALIADSCRDCPEELRKRCKTEPACADTKFLFEIPTVDAVPVVRCRGCKHARKSEDAFDFDGVTPLCECNYSRQPNRWHEYCSYGERKEGSEC